MNHKLGLYIHIPFCVQKCHYCDFLSFGGTDETTKARYVDSLIQELKGLSRQWHQHTLSTVYLGGGTPSLLGAEDFARLMTCVKSHFEIGSEAEITMEMNPGTVDEAKLLLYRQYGVNRVSMGLQSDDDLQLAHMGRVHDYNSFESTYQLLRKVGFDNINLDLMFGLSNQSIEDWDKTLTHVIGLDPEHISAYSLIIEPDTCYEHMFNKDQLKLPTEEEERAMFWHGNKRLTEAGYDHYEISNYSKPGKPSQHNGSYWDLTPYIGAGLGASSYYDQHRYKNISDLSLYIEAKGKVDLIRTVEQVCTKETDLEEAFFLGLRCLAGLDLDSLTATFGESLMRPYHPIIDQLLKEGTLIKKGHKICLTRRGIDISNQVLSNFIL